MVLSPDFPWMKMIFFLRSLNSVQCKYVYLKHLKFVQCYLGHIFILLILSQSIATCGWKMLFYFPVMKTSKQKQMSVTKHFCHCDDTFPHALVLFWLCSYFPSRSGTPDDGRPRYGFHSFFPLCFLLLPL